MPEEDEDEPDEDPEEEDDEALAMFGIGEEDNRDDDIFLATLAELELTSTNKGSRVLHASEPGGLYSLYLSSFDLTKD